MGDREVAAWNDKKKQDQLATMLHEQVIHEVVINGSISYCSGMKFSSLKINLIVIFKVRIEQRPSQLRCDALALPVELPSL